MAFRLPRNCLIDRGVQRLVTFRRTERLAQIRRVVLSKTHVESARASDTDPVARFAEIVRERRDKSQPTAGFLHADIARRSAGAVGDVFKRITLDQPSSHDGEWQVLIKARFIDIAKWHDLDH